MSQGENIRKAIERLSVYNDNREVSTFGGAIRTLISLAEEYLKVDGEKGAVMRADDIKEAVDKARETIGYMCDTEWGRQLDILADLAEEYLKADGEPKELAYDKCKYGSCGEYKCNDYEEGYNQACQDWKLYHLKQMDNTCDRLKKIRIACNDCWKDNGEIDKLIKYIERRHSANT